MAHLRPAGRPAPLIVALLLSLLLGGQAHALTIAIRSSGSSDGLLAAQDSREHGKETVSLVNARSLTPRSNLGLIAGEALRAVLEQKLGIREASGITGIEPKEDMRNQVSLAAEADRQQSQKDIVPFTADVTELSGLPIGSAATEAQPTAEPSSLQQTAEAADLADEGRSARFWLRAQRLLSSAMGCQHSAMSLAGMPMQFQTSEQLTGAGASADAKPVPQDLILSSSDVTMNQQGPVSRPLKVVMMWGRPLENGAQPSEYSPAAQLSWAQQAQLLIQKDGEVRPQTLSKLLNSLSSTQQANMAQPLKPQTDSLAWPLRVALLLQEVPQALAAGISAVRRTEVLADGQPTAVQSVGAQGATPTLVRLQLPAVADELEQEPDMGVSGEEEQPSSKGAPEQAAAAEDSPEGYRVTTELAPPLATAVAQAGAALAQRLGMEPGAVIDKVASAVLQRGMGGPVPLGSHEGMQSVIGGDMHSSLTDLDAESAAANAEVLAVPPQAGPDERETPLHRVASFFDQLLGQAARFLGSRHDDSGEEHAGDVRGPVVFSKTAQYGVPLEASFDSKAAVTLATASGQGASSVRVSEGEQGRAPEGGFAGGAFVEPDLVADSLSLPGAGTQALAPISANAHNNAEAEPVQAPQPEGEHPPALVVAVAPALRPAKAATAGNANAHNNANA